MSNNHAKPTKEPREKKGKHRHRATVWSFNLFQVPPKVIQHWCKCGKEMKW